MCELCGTEEVYDFHHLIPRTTHRKTWFKKRFTKEEMQRGLDLCKQCHNMIHDLIPDEKELGKHYNTKELLLEHPEVKKYVEWKRKRVRRIRLDKSCEVQDE